MKPDFNLHENITETKDVIATAKMVAGNIQNVSDDVKHELNQVLSNLNQAEHYLSIIETKTQIALSFVPPEIKKSKNL